MTAKKISLPEKLNRYFIESGVSKTWFANEIGMNRNLLYQILNGERNVPQKHWTKLIILANGKITLKDLLEETLNEVPAITFECEDFDECTIRLVYD